MKNKKLLDSLNEFLSEERQATKENLQNIKDTLDQNSFSAGYETSRIDFINEVKAFIKGKEYDFGEEY